MLIIKLFDRLHQVVFYLVAEMVRMQQKQTVLVTKLL